MINFNRQQNPLELPDYDVWIEEIVSTSEATIVVVGGQVGGEQFQWAGTAKRFPGDKHLPQIGIRLALSRAFAKASKQMARQANGAVKSLDDNRRQSQEAKKRKRPEKYKVQRTRKVVSSRRVRTSN